MDAEDRDVEVHGPAGTSLRMRGYDISHVTVMVFMIGMLVIAWYWGSKIVSAMEAMVEAQREFACIITFQQDERPKELYNSESYCKRLAKYGRS